MLTGWALLSVPKLKLKSLWAPRLWNDLLDLLSRCVLLNHLLKPIFTGLFLCDAVCFYCLIELSLFVLFYPLLIYLFMHLFTITAIIIITFSLVFMVLPSIFFYSTSCSILEYAIFGSCIILSSAFVFIYLENLHLKPSLTLLFHFSGLLLFGVLPEYPSFLFALFEKRFTNSVFKRCCMIIIIINASVKFN